MRLHRHVCEAMSECTQILIVWQSPAHIPADQNILHGVKNLVPVFTSKVASNSLIVQAWLWVPGLLLPVLVAA